MYQMKVITASTAQARTHSPPIPRMWLAMAGRPEQAPGPARGCGSARHWLARLFVANSRIAPMIVTVNTRPRKSLALCGGGLPRWPKPSAAAGSFPACHRCQHGIRAVASRDLMLVWVPSPVRTGTSVGRPARQHAVVTRVDLLTTRPPASFGRLDGDGAEDQHHDPVDPQRGGGGDAERGGGDARRHREVPHRGGQDDGGAPPPRRPAREQPSQP